MEWIMGCQCRYCSKIKYKYKRKEYIKLANNIDFFYDNMPHYWETYMKYLDDYDPFCGSAYEDQDRYELRTNTKTKFDNVILTPHIGGSTIEAQERIGIEVSRKIIQYTN